MNATSHPIEKQAVLVGAGNAHLVFVHMFRMKPTPGVAVTLVSEASVVPYSAMVPGHVGGEYTWDDITIDLVRLCRKSGVRFVKGRVTGIDTLRREVHVEGRPPLAYDAVGLGLGSRVVVPTSDQEPLMLRPLTRLLAKLDDFDARLASGRSLHLAIVGGGASGCELAAAIKKRLGKHAGFRLTLIHGGPTLLPYFQDVLTKAGVEVRLNERVRERPDADEVLWATDAAPPALLRDTKLSLDAKGFLAVRPTLQAENDDSAFGTGDCASFAAYPWLERNGVHAVRQGRVLFRNVIAYFHERPLRHFRPQWLVLNLLNTADGDAVFRYGFLTYKGRSARRLKDRIDRAWIHKFTVFPPMKEERGHLMRCGGCGAKVPGDVLSAALKRIDIADAPGVLIGTREAEDATVFAHGKDGQAEVQTVDYFKAFVDDPYIFGRVAALNAVSDLYAMNARPFSALAIATLPYSRGPIQEAMLHELLTGAERSLREEGVILAGGHTSEGTDLAMGFSVTGFADPSRLFRKGGLKVGDLLILTKPLGSGAILAAWMRGDCKAIWYEPLLAHLLTSNRDAGRIFAEMSVTACTDVTGFGLAGHLLEMLDASGASAKLHVNAVPVHAGFVEVVAAGITSTLHPGNARTAARVEGDAPAWMFDPQTSGGLLAGVRPEQAEETLRRLHDAGLTRAAVIGEVLVKGERVVIRC
jgi:selenide,water dikinase